ATVMTTQTEASPAIEPSPIPDTLVAASKQVKESNIEPFPSSASGVGTAIAGIGTRSSEPNQSLAGTSNKQVPAGAPEESKAAAPSTATSAVESSVAVAVAAQAPARTETKASGEVSRKVSPVATLPAAVPAAPRISAWSSPIVPGSASRRTLLVGGLLLAGMFLLAWAIAPELRGAFITRRYSHIQPLARPRTVESNIAPAENRFEISDHLLGGPRQVSLRLTASKPPSRVDAFGPAINLNGGASEASAYHRTEPHRESPPIAKLALESSLSPILNQTAEVSSPIIRKTPEGTEVPAISELWTTSAVSAEEPEASPIAADAVTTPAMEPVAAPEIDPIRQEQAIPYQTPVSAMDPSIAEAINDTPSHLPSATANEPLIPQITTAPTMPEHLETTAVPTALPIKTPTAEDASRPTSSMHTAVQLTFS